MLTSTLLEEIMRSKTQARKLNRGSTGEDYELGAFKQFSHNLVSLNSTQHPLSLTTHNSDLNNYHPSHHHHHPHNGYSRSDSPSRTLDSTGGPLNNTLPHTPAHMEQLLSSKLQAERLLMGMARLQEPICDLVPRENGVFAKQHLRRGTRFGPFALTEETDTTNAWDILPMSHIRSLLQPSPDVKNLLKKIRTVATSDSEKEANLNNFYIAGCLWYETNRDIAAGEEIIIDGRPKTPYDHNDSLVNGEAHTGSSIHSSEDRSERDNSSFYALKSDHIEGDISDDENGFDIRCEVCDKTFLELDRLDDHLVGQHHFRKDEFKCESCSNRFCHRPLLLKHRALIHNEIRKYPCENCTKVFCDTSNLQRHIRSRHIGARSHACPECGKTFGTSSGLKQHTHIHASVKPFQCEVCFKAYTQFSNLCRHKRMHADCRMQIKCSKCGQSFSTVTSLSKHKRFCDSTNVPPAGVGLPPNLPHSLHHQAQPHSPSQSRQTGVNGSLPPNMATPPNPFFFLRSPFFPAFPPAAAAYGLQGMFPQGPATQAHNFPLMFSKPNVDMLMRSQAQHPSSNKLNSMPLNDEMRVNESFGIPMPKPAESPSRKLDHTIKRESMERSPSSNHLRHVKRESQRFASDEESKSLAIPKVASPLETTAKNNREAERFNSNEESKSLVNLKVEPKGESASEVNSDDEEEETTSRINDEDKKSIDIVSVSPRHESEPKTISAELPLDLSVTRKRNSTDSNLSRDDELKSTQKENSFTNIRENSPAAPEDLSNSESDEPLNKKRKVFNSTFNSSRTPTASPGPTPSPSPPSNGTNSVASENGPPATMPTYPRPIHPMLLDELYRTHALESAFPRPFPFLGLMGERPAFDANTLRARGEPFPPEPIFREALRGLSSGVMQAAQTGKLKDRYTCKFCGKVFPRSANLTRHLRTHTGEQPYTCKYCDRAFSISSNLQRHVRNIHNKERPFRCHLCDRCFGQQTNLDRHLKKHEADTTGMGLAISDSPSSNEADREDSYFDEIRNFMDRVTYNEELYTPTSMGNVENDTDYNGSDNENELSVSRPSTPDINVDQKEILANHERRKED